jgi:hypothetical protein
MVFEIQNEEMSSELASAPPFSSIEVSRNRITMRVFASAVLLLSVFAATQDMGTRAGNQTTIPPINTSTHTLGQTRFAGQFPGADIFAKANTAAATLYGGPGEIVIPPGSYTVTNTLRCESNVAFVGRGVVIYYIGNGSAISCANVAHATVEGFNIIGPGPEGSAIGLEVGPTLNRGTGIVTSWNAFTNIHIENFNVGVDIDGSAASPPAIKGQGREGNCTGPNGNGTYTNTFNNVTVFNSVTGWDIEPTCPGYVAANIFVGCDAEGTGSSSNNSRDGLVIDGSNGNWFFGFRSENNSRLGVNLPGTQLTNGNAFSGGWFEGNSAGDIKFGSASNVVRTRVYGAALNSTPQITGSPAGLLNEIIEGSSGYSNDYYSGPFRWHVTTASGNATDPWIVHNDENPPSGKTSILAVLRNGANAGNVLVGTPEYPVTINGNLHVNGTLSKSSGSFKIDHPLDPANKYLSHSFVESPDMMNIYDGVVTLDKKGTAEVQLPDWFQALNRDFRYQLTCIGGFAPVYVSAEIKDNKFRIAGGRAGLKISWLVTGIRHDSWAEAHRIRVEEVKPRAERGTYLHPELVGSGTETPR